MKKLLIASAVSAAFAAPTLALAQAARAPTIGQVLDASGISVNGYIDAAYSYANKNIQTGFTDRAFDSENNSFALHQFGLTVAKQPRQGYGGVINITAGSDARLIHSSPEPATSTFDLTQAYGQYASGGLTLMAGKFTTLAGTEVIASTGNNNFSRSILFTAVPHTHTGVRAGYAVSDTTTLYGGINNGWDQLIDANRGKTLELGASFTPTRALSINVSAYAGQEPVGAGNQDQRTLIDVTGNYVVNRVMSIGAEILTASQDLPAGGSAKYNGIAGYLTYSLSREWRLAGRLEMFDDKQGFHFANGTGTKYNELTATLAYLPNSSVELRGEVRADRADTAVFTDAGSTSKSLQTFALQGIYKF